MATYDMQNVNGAMAYIASQCTKPAAERDSFETQCEYLRTTYGADSKMWLAEAKRRSGPNALLRDEILSGDICAGLSIVSNYMSQSSHGYTMESFFEVDDDFSAYEYLRRSTGDKNISMDGFKTGECTEKSVISTYEHTSIDSVAPVVAPSIGQYSSRFTGPLGRFDDLPKDVQEQTRDLLRRKHVELDERKSIDDLLDVTYPSSQGLLQAKHDMPTRSSVRRYLTADAKVSPDGHIIPNFDGDFDGDSVAVAVLTKPSDKSSLDRRIMAAGRVEDYLFTRMSMPVKVTSGHDKTGQALSILTFSLDPSKPNEYCKLAVKPSELCQYRDGTYGVGFDVSRIKYFEKDAETGEVKQTGSKMIDRTVFASMMTVYEHQFGHLSKINRMMDELPVLDFEEDVPDTSIPQDDGPNA